jgi:hypothetical protein
LRFAFCIHRDLCEAPKRHRPRRFRVLLGAPGVLLGKFGTLAVADDRRS